MRAGTGATANTTCGYRLVTGAPCSQPTDHDSDGRCYYHAKVAQALLEPIERGERIAHGLHVHGPILARSRS